MSEFFAEWAIVELMGHRRLAGHLSEQQIGGATFLRCDIPGSDDVVATQLYTPSAVYCITPCDETTARRVAQLTTVAPVQRWELPAALEVDADDSDDQDDTVAAVIDLDEDGF